MMSALAAAVLWMGVYPESFLAPMRKDIAALDARLARAKPEGDAKPTAGKPAAPQEHGQHHENPAHEGAH
jgi:NADH-quinone oxidoreductase subunit M